MRTPTKAQIQTVIDNLIKILPQATAKENFDMAEGKTTCEDGTICGTVHCIGGWYAIATLKFDGRMIDYRHGADQMAIHLGFEDYNELKNWAYHNPIIWGNHYGYGMFCDELAYDGAHTLAEAITHIENVRDRLPK